MLQGLTAKVPARFFGNAEAVDVRFDAIVKMGNVLQVVVGRAYRRVAEKPQECGFFSVLLDDLLDDWQASILQRESQAPLAGNGSAFDSIDDGRANHTSRPLAIPCCNKPAAPVASTPGGFIKQKVKSWRRAKPDFTLSLGKQVGTSRLRSSGTHPQHLIHEILPVPEINV